MRLRRGLTARGDSAIQFAQHCPKLNVGVAAQFIQVRSAPAYAYQRTSAPQSRYEERILGAVALPEAEKLFAQRVGFSARSAFSRPISSAAIRSNSVTEFSASVLNVIGRFFAAISLAPRRCERLFQSP